MIIRTNLKGTTYLGKALSAEQTEQDERENAMSEKGKTIVISDIHVSNGEKYSWFLHPYPGYLTDMLNGIARDSSVEELVLLGDLFDLWLYPIDVVPWTVEQILGANPGLADALRNCVQKIPNVYYMNGNHDMGVVNSDLEPLSSGEKKVQLVTPDWYNEHHQGQRHLEHGHAVDMFNAPDNSIDTIGDYPLGFFITRLVATADNQSAVWHVLKELLEKFGATHRIMSAEAVEVTSVGKFFVETIITVLAKLAGTDDNEKIRFSEPTLDNKYTVGDIKEHYNSLFFSWLKKYPNPDDFLSAMLTGLLPDGLDWYAKKLLSNKPKPVIAMGHTHHAKSEDEYDNDGCWCIPSSLGHGDKTPYYIEIVGNTTTLKPW